MANSQVSFRELRFVINDETTDVYLYLQAFGDSPLTVQGWRHKTFSARYSVMDILEEIGRDSPLTWDSGAPRPPRMSERGISAAAEDGDD